MDTSIRLCVDMPTSSLDHYKREWRGLFLSKEPRDEEEDSKKVMKKNYNNLMVLTEEKQKAIDKSTIVRYVT